jgi:hypothetical protein
MREKNSMRPNKVKLALVGLVCLLTVSCGKKKEADTEIVYDLSNAEQVLLSDINRLREMGDSFSLKSGDLASMGLGESVTSVTNWIDQRVNYILPEMPDREYGKRISDSELEVLASNQGTAIYHSNPNSQFLIRSDTVVTVSTPRVGMLAVGPGLFNAARYPDPNNAGAFANSLFRIVTLAHEARHSDGRGNSLGFLHVKCPVGHQYAGQEVCDAAVNGPYKIGSLLAFAFVDNCPASKCSKREIEILRTRAEDSRDRVIKGSTEVWDPTPVAPYGAPFGEMFRQYAY